MSFLNKNRLSLSLIIGSLLLLLAFQAMWLRSSYEQEKEALLEQADLVFMDAVRSIEDSILRIAILDPIAFACDDSTAFADIKVALGINLDTIKTEVHQISSVKRYTKLVEEVEEDSVFQIDIRTDFRNTRQNNRFGSLSFFIATTDSMDHHSPFLESCADNNIAPELLESELQKTVPLADLPQDYRLAILTEELQEDGGLYSSTQQDMLRGGHYALFFPTYQGFIFKKMIPQILFSILLFGIILLSFYLVWQSLEKQRRLTELKNDFISNVTHELKTPITTVGVAIEALSNFNAMDNPERTKEYLDISKHELNRLTILVDKVLKMSLFEKKAPELKIETFDLHSLVQDVLGSMKLQFDKFSAKVNLQQKGSLFQLQGDRIHLTSVIYNLIDNALKYSPDHPEIDLILEEENDQINFSVKDKGLGIPEVYQDKIFDKFFRVPSGDQHDIKGHGLGLSYVAGVIAKHKGQIKVISKKDMGTQFTISLPKLYSST